MPLTPGTRLGRYEVLAPLGSGGMGEVYRARDPQLGREVAIKVLPDAVVHDPERLARFEREARLLAALGHAGIAAIFGVESADGAPALVMELVEGPTLAERIAHGAMPPDEALPVARQIAEALEYAHERGIVHRDLKPANVKLRPDGTVKVLDFGLARALDTEPAGSAAALSQSPTLTDRMTQAGMILGTAAYMAPEQARGRGADRRADVWAFGAVLYEMLSGRGAFAGETVSETLAAVMRDAPDWSALPAGLGSGWRRLLERCLEKDPRRRMQAVGEARIALEDLSSGGDGPGLPSSTVALPRRRGVAPLVPWTVAALMAFAALAMLLTRPPTGSPALELSIVPAAGLDLGDDISYNPIAIAPDGRAVAYTVRVDNVLRMRLRRLDLRQDVEIAGADGARNLFFSLDGQWIGFFDSRHLQKISVRGGTPVILDDALQDRLGTWLDDGTIVYSREVTQPLYRIPEAGGTPVAVTRLDSTKRERTHRFPSALDGGPWVVFTVQTIDSPGGYDDASIDAVSVKTGERRHLFKGARRAMWAPGGHLVLARGNDLYATPIDPRNPRITRDPVPVLQGVRGDVSSGASFFDIAHDGTLAWVPGGDAEKTREIGWMDRAGRWTPVPVPAGPYLKLALSSDGARALVHAGAGGGSGDLWLADLRTGAMRQLTHGGRAGSAVWLPGEMSFAYSRGEPRGGESVVSRRLDGAGGERELYRSSNPVYVTDVTADGRWLMVCDYGVRQGRIRLVSTDGGAAPRELPADGDGYDIAGMVSPDGQWLAYLSNKSRREQVYVRPLNGTGSWQISNSTGGNAGGVRWGRAGRELFFVSGEALMRIPVELRGEELVAGGAEPLFRTPGSPTEITFSDYDYDPVTDRFLITRPPGGVSERREIAVSVGWGKRLGERLRNPTPRP
jgi:serine/threonine-protein kinase